MDAQLWFFLRQRWVSRWIWCFCLGGTVYLFNIVRKPFAIGDSSFIRACSIAQEGSFADANAPVPSANRRDPAGQPAVDETVTLSGVSAFQANQGVVLAILKDPSARPPIGAVAGQLMGAAMMKTPGLLTFLQPNPVLQISTGATSQTQGQFAYGAVRVQPQRVIRRRRQVHAEDV